MFNSAGVEVTCTPPIYKDVVLVLPFTSKLYPGRVVPIPTLPLASLKNRVSLPLSL